MDEGLKTYKIECTLPTGTMVWEAVQCGLLCLITLGFAFPLCLVYLGRLLLSHTRVVESG